MIPEINSKVLSVRLVFCDRFRYVRRTRSLIFFTPASVSHPPQISSSLRFLKSAWHKNIQEHLAESEQETTLVKFGILYHKNDCGQSGVKLLISTILFRTKGSNLRLRQLMQWWSISIHFKQFVPESVMWAPKRSRCVNPVRPASTKPSTTA